ncbi:MAG: hypothetical protein Tsb005_14290 [Gammaproteobacteria bacterium]
MTVFSPFSECEDYKRIPYIENLPTKSNKITYLTPQAFQEKFNCEYFEGIQTPHEKYQSIEPHQLTTPLEKAIYHRLMNPLDCLAICKMDDQAGYGLFALEDIALGTLITIYSGEYAINSEGSAYTLSQTNATNIGGMARFMQHLPIIPYTHVNFLCQSTRNPQLYALINNLEVKTAQDRLNDTDYIQDELEMIFYVAENHPEHYDSYQLTDIEPSIKPSIADSNIFYKIIEINSIEVIAMFAMRDIKKNEILGFSYGTHYWENHPTINQPLLFDKQGNTIAKSALKFAIPQKHVTNLSHLSTQTLETMLKQLEIQEDSEEESEDDDYQEDFGIYPTQTIPFAHDTFDTTARATIFPEKMTTPTTPSSYIKEAETQLKTATLSFFKKTPTTTQWKHYPNSKLVGKYIGHQVRFFTMNAHQTSQAQAFAKNLQKIGFDAEIKKANEKPSIVVDLTTSGLSFNTCN